mmetsp:Transcript_463/g.958  ORF Transcript_463/g.958 Transcript_463/m.958 type:complete len:278 (+) Transcript_463:1071-1904(+)
MSGCSVADAPTSLPPGASAAPDRACASSSRGCKQDSTLEAAGEEGSVSGMCSSAATCAFATSSPSGTLTWQASAASADVAGVTSRGSETSAGAVAGGSSTAVGFTSLRAPGFISHTRTRPPAHALANREASAFQLSPVTSSCSCPCRRPNTVPSAMFHRTIEASPPPEATRKGVVVVHATARTGLVCSWSSFTHWPLPLLPARSQNLSERSADPLTIRRPSCDQATDRTQSLWPASDHTHVPFAASHTFTVSAQVPQAMMSPTGPQATLSTPGNSGP